MKGFYRTKTNRGFTLIKFKDVNGNNGTIQASSSAAKPMIWLGTEEERVHLDRSQAWKVAWCLIKFVVRGRL